MRVVLFCTALATAPLGIGSAQDADPEILRPVRQLFDAMRARDTAALRAVFDRGARLVSTTTREGKPVVRVVPIDRFIQSVAGATQTLDERLAEPEVRQDEHLATVWARYAFYLGGQRSHCGVDAFQLTRGEGGWRIVALADTQRRESCPAEP